MNDAYNQNDNGERDIHDCQSATRCASVAIVCLTTVRSESKPLKFLFQIILLCHCIALLSKHDQTITSTT